MTAQYTRQAARHSSFGLRLRQALCSVLGHDEAVSFDSERLRLYGCLRCCRIVRAWRLESGVSHNSDD